MKKIKITTEQSSANITINGVKVTSKKMDITESYIKKSLRNNNYDLETALSELIDNSIDAKSNTINVTIPNKEELKTGNKPIIITDDGTGMSMVQLQSCFDLGCQRTYASDDIGIYGFGMKAALAYLGQRAIIETKLENSDVISVADWNIENDPLVQSYYERIDANFKRGTRITIYTKIEGSIKSRLEDFSHTQPAYVKKIAGGRYYHAMSDKKYLLDTTQLPQLRININDSDLFPFDPMYRNSELTKKDFRTVEINVDGIKYNIEIKGYYIGYNTEKKGYDKRESNGFSFDKQGVYLLLANKYIQLGGSWLGCRQSQHYLNNTRCELIIPKELIEYFGISVNKNSSIDLVNSSEENQSAAHTEKMKIVSAVSAIANWGYDEYKKQSKKTKSVDPEDKKQSEKLTNEINLKFKNAKLQQFPYEKLEKLSDRRPKSDPTGKTKKRKSGLEYNKNQYFDIDYFNGGQNSNFWKLEKDGRKVAISFNKDHSFYDKYLNNDNVNLMIELLCSMALAEVDSYDHITPSEWENIWYRVGFWINKLNQDQAFVQTSHLDEKLDEKLEVA